MEMGVEIDAVSERLDDRDNTGLKCFPRRGLKTKEKRSNGRAAELSQELALERTVRSGCRARYTPAMAGAKPPETGQL
jgi:hypothetical protein